ncbi:MAG: hypothetical protein ABJF63_14380 [Ekhidna sp.]
MILIRFVQSYFIGDQSHFGLKWLLLGDWLNQGYSMYSEAFDYTGPIAVLFYKYLTFLLGRTEFIHYGVSSLVIIFQAGIFNQLLLRNKAFDENSYLPAFLYVILMVSVPDFMTLSPQLLSLTFVLMSLRNVLRRIDNQVTDELFLNSGIYIGVATMIYLPAIVFLIVFLFALILFSTAVARRLILYLFSFLLVFALCSLYFYWRDDLSIFFDSYITQNFILSAQSNLSIVEGLIISSGLIVIFLLSILKTWSSSRLTNFQQKIQQVIWLMFLGAGGTFFLSNEKALHELVFLIPGIAYFWTYYFILLKRRVFRFLMPVLMVLGLLAFSFYSYENLYVPLEIQRNEAPKERTMILGENIDYYADIPAYTPCFHNILTERAFHGLEYYGSAGRLYKLLEKTEPDYIIDEIDIIDKLFYRFPIIEESYEAVDQKKYRKINN